MSKKIVMTGALCEAPAGEYALETIKREKLGTYLPLSVGPWKPDMLRKACEFARVNHMKIGMDEMISRMTGDWRDDYAPYVDENIAILNEYRDVIYGASVLNEYGGIRFYWPLSSVSRSATQPSDVFDYEAAEKDFVNMFRTTLNKVRARGLKCTLKSVEARGNAVSHYYRAGIDKINIEMTYRDDVEMMFAAAKGATNAFRKDSFGIDIATLWYGGNVHDELWFNRWKTSLYHAFLRGADPIYAEHGISGYENVLGSSASPDAPDVVKFRKVLSEFADFVRRHPREQALPEATVAVMQGHLDGYVGYEQTHIWGIRKNDDFKIGDPERSWDLFNTLYTRRPWQSANRTGLADFSGNPPLGQADIIPFDIPDELLAAYKVVIFLGRNVMNDDLYRKLVQYVRNGGQLLIAAAHFDTTITPKAPFTPYMGGNWTELCGVKIQSDKVYHPYGIKFKQMPECGWILPLWTSVCDPKYPGFGYRSLDLKIEDANTVLLGASSDRFNDQDLEVKADSGCSATFSRGKDAEAEAWKRMIPGMLYCKKNGKGCTVLVNSLDYPGAPGMTELYANLMNAACDANRSYPRVECSDRVRYSVYPGNPRTLYILNTEEHLDAPVRIHWSEDSIENKILSAGEIMELEIYEKKGRQ